MVFLATITIRVDEEVKKQAEIILNDIGINLTTLFSACLKALVRENRVPFELASTELVMRRMIREKLDESKAAAADPNATRYTHDEIFGPMRKKYGYGIQD